MKAEIIAVGSELLTPYRLDTHSLVLTHELNQLGIRVVYKNVVGDSLDDMRTCFAIAVLRADLIVASGGLGPTDDDRTRDAIAEVLSRKLQLTHEVLEKIKERFRRYNRTMPEINARKGMAPKGERIFPISGA